MSPSRRGLILSAAAAALIPATAHAAAKDDKPVPAKKIFPFLDLYLQIPSAERTRFTLAYYLSVNDAPAAGRTLWLLGEGGGRTALTAAADGRMTRLPTLADLKRGATIDVERSSGDRFRMAMEMQALVKPADIIAAGELVAAVDQCNAAIRKQAGLIGFAAPRMEQVLFVGASGGRVVLADGKAVPLPMADGKPAFRPADHPDGRSLAFSRPPTRMVLSGKSK